jgi:GNAT superfamily N-acetyltransferase
MPPSSLTFTAIRPDAPDALALLTELDVDLHRHDYPPESRHAFSVDKLLRHGIHFFLAYADNSPAGCGGVQLVPATDHDAAYAEVKRMFVRPTHRRLGIGKAILHHLATHARQHGIHLLRLETGIYQQEAIALYEAFGFHRRGPFADYREDPLSVYLELSLV